MQQYDKPSLRNLAEIEELLEEDEGSNCSIDFTLSTSRPVHCAVLGGIGAPISPEQGQLTENEVLAQLSRSGSVLEAFSRERDDFQG